MNIGNIGESEVELYFLRRGYEIYRGAKNNFFDLIVYNPATHHMKTLEVKTTSRRNKNNKAWIVDIRRSYGNLPFASDKVDLLAVYIEPVKEIRIFKGSEVAQTTTLTLPDNVGE
jgi:hypothetical protein